jgi:hypothetical protein
VSAYVQSEVKVTANVTPRSSAQANDFNIRATLTADNFYGLYIGNEQGTNLKLIGRNESTALGNPGIYNWSLPETWNFSVSPTDYVYVVTWDDGTVAASWIGEFDIDGNKNLLLSKGQDWQYFVTNESNTFNNGNSLPKNLETEILSANTHSKWIFSKEISPNGTSPWGRIPGIDNSANFLTTTSLQKKYAVFRWTRKVKDYLTGGQAG